MSLKLTISKAVASYPAVFVTDNDVIINLMLCFAQLQQMFAQSLLL